MSGVLKARGRGEAATLHSRLASSWSPGEEKAEMRNTRRWRWADPAPEAPEPLRSRRSEGRPLCAVTLDLQPATRGLLVPCRVCEPGPGGRLALREDRRPVAAPPPKPALQSAAHAASRLGLLRARSRTSTETVAGARLELLHAMFRAHLGAL